MTLFGKVVGGALFGFGVRCYSMGLQLKPMFSQPSGHFAFMGVFSGIGYYLHGLEERQTAVIEGRRAKLEERKQQRLMEAEQ